MSHQKKGPEKYALLTLCRMPCSILMVPISQRETVRYLEREGLATYSSKTKEWTRTKKGRAFVKAGGGSSMIEAAQKLKD